MFLCAGAAFAGPAAEQLGSASGVATVADAAIDMPSAPADAGGDVGIVRIFDEGLAKANCAAHPMSPGCPGYCKVSPAYPGCPMFCKDHHGHPACAKSFDAHDADEAKKVVPGYPKPPHPQYCQNHHGLPSCRGEKSVADADYDSDLAKANCVSNPAAPGCPLFCRDHHAYPGCPQYCAANPLSSACRKSVSGAKSNCAYNPSAPGCSAYCASPGMQMQPGCPMYCSAYPSSPECN